MKTVLICEVQGYGKPQTSWSVQLGRGLKDHWVQPSHFQDEQKWRLWVVHSVSILAASSKVPSDSRNRRTLSIYVSVHTKVWHAGQVDVLRGFRQDTVLGEMRGSPELSQTGQVTPRWPACTFTWQLASANWLRSACWPRGDVDCVVTKGSSPRLSSGACDLWPWGWTAVSHSRFYSCC